MFKDILNIINVPLGYLFRWLYTLVNDYGVAIILIAVITKILMLPLGVKQHKSTLSQLKYRPRIQEIQTKYKDNPERMQREMAKLQEEGYSPTAGCSTMLIQFPILIGIYNVIRHPLKYIIGLSEDVLEGILSVVQKVPGLEAMKIEDVQFEINAITQIKENAAAYADIITPEKLELIESFNLNLFGLDAINLAVIPEKIQYFLSGLLPIPTFSSWLVIIPILSGITALIYAFVSQKIGPSAMMQDESRQNAATMKFMTFLTPYMSYAIAFSVPAGLGLYWICSNLFMLVQTLVINKIYDPAKYIEQMKAEEEARKLKRKKAQQRIAEEKRAEKESEKAANKGKKQLKDKEDIPGDNN